PAGARGDLAQLGRRSVEAPDRHGDAAGSVNDQSRSCAQWWPDAIPSERCGRGGLGTRPAPEAVSVGGPWAIAANRGPETQSGVVARADRRLAEAAVSESAGAPDLPRDHLPQPLHPGPRRAQEGTRSASAHGADDAPLAAGEHRGATARSDHRRRVDP